MVSETLINEGIRSTEEKQLAWEKANPVHGCNTLAEDMIRQINESMAEDWIRAAERVWDQIHRDLASDRNIFEEYADGYNPNRK